MASKKSASSGWEREIAFGLSFAAIVSCRAVDEMPPPTVSTSALTCGEERWSVKTGTDEDAWSVDATPVEMMVSDLVTFPRPSSLPANHRLGPHERQVYRLTAVLTHYKLETDSDYHLVLSDGSHTLIAEIPAPDCVGPSSPFLSDVRRARAAFDARFTATPSFLTANATATVLGVGFFDFIHGQSGVAPNGFELHPVTAICFGAGCVVDAERGDGGSPSNPGGTTGSHPGLNGCGCSLGTSGQLLWPALAIAWARRKIARNRRRSQHPHPLS